jgi:hypothetical protein
MNDNMTFKGKLKLELFSETGELKQVEEVNNLVVTAGKDWVAALMQSGTGNVMSHMAVGTNSTAATAGDTTLGTELSRIALTVAGGTRTNNAIDYVASYGAGVGTGALVEAGLFNAASVGTMLARTVFSVINKGASDTLQITWTVTAG